MFKNIIKKAMLSIGAIALAAVGMTGFAATADAADAATITFPADRGIFQRDADNVADITVKATFDGSDTLKARVENAGAAVADWVELKDENGTYTAVIENVPAGGWYELVVASFDAAGAETSRATIEKIGVGEVFITGGQSNSTNFGGAKTVAESDLVSAIDVKNKCWVHCEDSQPNNSGFNTGNGGGSPWPTTGDKLVESLNVPVGFVSTGVGGSLIAELADPDKNYKPIKEAIEFLEPYGCRAFLIHQGEADSGGMNGNPGTEMSVYKETFEQLIAQTREDAGYDLNWLIARVSYAWSGFNNPERTKEVTETQTAICNNYNIFVGPDTDVLQGEDRHTDNLHLSEQGLIKHGTMWSECIIEAFFTPRKLNADASVTGGKIEQCDKELFGGQTVKLTAVPDEGYYLVPGSYKVFDANGEEVEVTDDSFIMRAEDMTVSATFAALPAHFGNLLTSIKAGQAVNAADYEAAGITALNTAIENGKKVYANANATEAETTAAKTAIDNAIKALVKKVTVVNPPVAQPTPAAVLPAKGTVVAVGNVKYVITASTDSSKTVSVKGLVKKNKASVTIPKSIKIEGKTYNVTGISKNAFKGAKKLKKVVIKSTAIKSVGKNAFAKVNAKVKIKVHAKKLAAYKKLIKKSGFKKVSAIKK